MNELANCIVETLLEDSELVIWRAQIDDGSSSWLLASLASDRRAAGLTKLQHAHSLREELDFSWAARPLELTEFRGRAALLMEDPGGYLLSGLLGQPLTVPEFLRLAIGIVRALGELHRRGLVHKDVKPANLIVNVQTGAAWLTGFGITSRLSRHRQSPQPPETISGTLAFMAPEQTGRMNRSIDSRSDLYSLGVTFYQMIVGEPPFVADDPMEWVHCHIARLPVAPGVRRKEIPEAISGIVMKLLAKAPEGRYQTASGVEADLRHCLEAWESQGHIPPFPLGEHDTSCQLMIPEKLYGREKEIELLLASFDRVVTDGRAELVLVSGYSGVGKSSVVNEVHKALVPPRGLFASGKFDQYQRDVPYATLAQALQKLVRQVLTQSDADVLRRREVLVEAVGPHGRIMIDLVPEMELIIGEQPPVPELPPQEAQHRFQMVFRRTLGVFARPEHPLALFLDDLQWLDAATLDLLHHLVTHDEVRHLLLIGAYRDNEVGPAHPLMRTLAEISKAGAPVYEIRLENLGLGDMIRLVSDSFHRPQEEVHALARLLHEKTGGNPFFAIQFISALEEEGLLAFSPEIAAWRWNIDQIRAKGFTENVVDLMVAKLSRLPATAQEALKQLACLGNVAQTTTLVTVFGEAEERVHQALWDAVRAGLVSRSGDAYFFAHDRIQEAASVMIPEERRAAEHLRIGRLMVSQSTDPEIEERIFDIVNQFNRGLPLISSQEERERVAELNLLAGRRAKASSAYASALNYFSAGSALLVPESWTQRYSLAFELKLQEAACQLLNADFAAAEEIISLLLVSAKSKVDQAAAYRLKIELHILRSENALAVESALECLRILGIEMPPHPSQVELESVFAEVWRRIGDRSIEALVDLPRVTDPEVEAAMRVLAVLYEPALFTDERLVGLHLGQMVLLTLERGITEASAHAFGLFGFTLGYFFGRYEEGFRFGQLARAVVERHGFAAYDAKTLYSLEVVSVWTRPISFAIKAIHASFVAAVRSGDIPYACYACNHGVTDQLVRGDHLDEVWKETERGLAFVSKTKFDMVTDVIVTQQRFIQSMRGRTDSFDTFNEEGFDEGSFEAAFDPERTPTMVCWYWIIKAQVRFIYGDFESAADALARARPLLWSSLGHIQNVDYHFFSALTLAALDSDRVPGLQPGESRRQIQAHGEWLARWAESCPATFADKHTLIMAEVARVEGRTLQAEHLYDEAIRLARENGLTPDEGIANEIAARFYLGRGAERTVHSYLREARSCFQRWGALGKVRQLDLLHPHLRRDQEPSATHSTDDAAGMDLDLATVVKMSQAVSEEIVLDRLIEKLLVMALKYAGAVRGFLILPQGHELRIEAEATASQEATTVAFRQEGTRMGGLPESIFRYVVRTLESVLLDDAAAPNDFSTDDYIREKRPRSLLCLPLVKQARLIGILYLENNFASHVFTPPRIAVLQLLASQAAISLENARLYADVRRAEEKTKHSERELRLAIDKMPALTWSAQADGSEERFNKQWHDYTGIPPQDACNGGWKAAFHPDDLDHVVTVWSRILTSGESSEVEARLRRFDSEYRWFLVRASPLRDETGKIIKWYGTKSDIDDLKRAEALLAGEKRLFEMIATGRPLPAILDVLCHTVEHLNGGSPSSILLLDTEGKSLWTGAAPNLPDAYTRAIDGVPIGPSAGSCGTAAYRRKAVLVSDIATDPLWVDYRDLALQHGLRACWSTPILSTKGVVLGTIAIYSLQSREITDHERKIVEQFTHLASIVVERKRAEEALRKSEAFLAEGQRISHMGSWAWNIKTGKLTWSEEQKRIFGFPSDVEGLTFDDFAGTIHPEDRTAALQTIDEAAQVGRAFDQEFRIVLPDGAIRFIHGFGRPVVDESGALVEYFGAILDITDRKRSEDDLRRSEVHLRKLQAELAHVARTTTMGELTASIAHEVGQPLTGVVTNANASMRWLAADTPNLEEARGAIQRAIRDGKRAGEVITRIRKLFRKEESSKEPLDINEVIQEVIVLTRSELEKNDIALRLHLAADLPPVLGDRVQLQQVLMNLILNAIDAMISLETGSRELAITTNSEDGDLVYVEVQDTGPGVAANDSARIFEPFHTSKSGGMGMGLSICRTIVEDHGGHLNVVPHEEPGARFQFTLVKVT
jgi:PAS domain S-box-containing protein